MAKRFLNLATDPARGRSDVVIGVDGGGTELSVLDVRVYRLIEGKLYLVFKAEEENHGHVMGSDRIIDEQSNIQMMPPDRITVRQLKKAGCTMYRFNAVRVEFLATAERCR